MKLAVQKSFRGSNFVRILDPSKNGVTPITFNEFTKPIKIVDESENRLADGTMLMTSGFGYFQYEFDGQTGIRTRFNTDFYHLESKTFSGRTVFTNANLLVSQVLCHSNLIKL